MSGRRCSLSGRRCSLSGAGLSGAGLRWAWNNGSQSTWTVSDSDRGWLGHGVGLAVCAESGWVRTVRGELGDDLGGGDVVGRVWIRVGDARDEWLTGGLASAVGVS